MPVAATELPFGTPIRLIGERWHAAETIAEMQGVAARPRSANRLKDEPAFVSPSLYAAGEEVTRVVTDGDVLMVFPEKRSVRGGFVVLAGQHEYVRIAGGKLAV